MSFNTTTKNWRIQTVMLKCFSSPTAVTTSGNFRKRQTKQRFLPSAVIREKSKQALYKEWEIRTLMLLSPQQQEDEAVPLKGKKKWLPTRAAISRCNGSSSVSVWLAFESPWKHTSGMSIGVFPERLNWRWKIHPECGHHHRLSCDARLTTKKAGWVPASASLCCLTADTVARLLGLHAFPLSGKLYPQIVSHNKSSLPLLGLSPQRLETQLTHKAKHRSSLGAEHKPVKHTGL